MANPIKKNRSQEYTVRDAESGVEESFQAGSWEEARERAEKFARDGDYDASEGTIWIDVYIEREDGKDDKITVQIDPPDPPCIDTLGAVAIHAWKSPYELVGGSQESPGVFGSGGGVLIKEACIKCGSEKTTDTWAQRRDTGEQGLESVSYEEGKYSIEEFLATQYLGDAELFLEDSNGNRNRKLFVVDGPFQWSKIILEVNGEPDSVEWYWGDRQGVWRKANSMFYGIGYALPGVLDWMPGEE